MAIRDILNRDADEMTEKELEEYIEELRVAAQKAEEGDGEEDLTEEEKEDLIAEIEDTIFYLESVKKEKI